MKWKLAPISIALVLILTSCSSKYNNLKVSIDGDERVLIPGVYDEELYIYEDSPIKIPDKKAVMEMDSDKIIVKLVEPTSSGILCVNNGYFVGVNVGEFDGWVKYFPYYSDLTDMTGGTTVIHENWVDFIKIDNSFGYVITYIPSILGNGSGSIYTLELIESEWTWNLFASLDFIPCSVTMVNDNMIIAGKGTIVEVDDVGTINTIVKSDILTYPDSIVVLNGRYYCVDSIGIYEYDTSDSTEKWFPFWE